ncbi:alpha/beta hydrolase [Nocardia paucivorans]|uniref:alpha/beta hydrolase n=1 Tax=Nocardia paucivorans TaxID=114259 RepID=UPI0002FE6895|nr:alpha/beta hydrolase [Nocardia paucivorans]
MRALLVAGLVALAMVVVPAASQASPGGNYYEDGMARVRAAGFVEKQVEIEGYPINYAEGPDNGSPLVLVHGQASLWQDHLRVLPELAAHHHVFAVDVPGHGGSARLPADEYTNVRVAGLIADFMARVVGAPAVLAGHSSGALISAWIAANRPWLVRGLVLEDPPFFSSIMPRAEKTTGGDIARVTHDFLAQDEETDFQRYYLRHSKIFDLFGPLAGPIADYCVHYRNQNPDRPVEAFFLPDELNIFLRGIADYDPAFGAAWRDNSWYEGFDTEAILAAIEVPTVLIHTDYWFVQNGTYYDRNGVLMAAMDDKDLARTTILLGNPPVVEVASGHLVHFEKSEIYTRTVLDFAAEAS